MVEWKKEWKKLALIVGVLLACFYLPVGRARFDRAVLESLHLVKWYAQEHVLLCLIPAFFPDLLFDTIVCNCHETPVLNIERCG